mmetsp:Transcript_38796/g.121609  ORF Transcript_38796/g.121609 Transcript_38796/m.121609 type:complete len:227 (+) Transcript_38796:7477-8157(+)
MRHFLSGLMVFRFPLWMSLMPLPQLLAKGLQIQIHDLWPFALRYHEWYSPGRMKPSGKKSYSCGCRRRARVRQRMSLSLRPMHHEPGKWFTFCQIVSSLKACVVGCFAHTAFQCPLCPDPVSRSKPARVNAFLMQLRSQWHLYTSRRPRPSGSTKCGMARRVSRRFSGYSKKMVGARPRKSDGTSRTSPGAVSSGSSSSTSSSGSSSSLSSASASTRLSMGSSAVP